jgi:hypothetical protein
VATIRAKLVVIDLHSISIALKQGTDLNRGRDCVARRVRLIRCGGSARVAVNVSPAYLFRKVGSGEGATLLYDEIDTVFGPKARENEELRGLLNAGHRKGAVAGRCVVRGKKIETEEIPAYAAVAMAGLGWLPDTILSRSVIIRMRRRHAGERVEPYRRRVHAAEGYRVQT